ncbi:hypothetical protein VULLAG_LOCUS21796 [Vulpes lagopus]
MYQDMHFIAAVCDQICNISEECQYWTDSRNERGSLGKV